MSADKVEAIALLPGDEARHLVLRAAEQGITTPEWLGYLILMSAYGALHPEVRAFQARSKLGQKGSQETP